jgi:GTPase SAR1 family protein
MKIHVLGSRCVGKTTLLRLLTGEPFHEIYEQTLKDVYYDTEIANIRYEVWDSSNKQFTDFTKADLVILMFDVTQPSSFQYARNTYLQIKDQVPVLFMGNKRDLATRQVYQPWLQALPEQALPITYLGWSLKYDFDPVYLRYKIVEALDKW